MLQNIDKDSVDRLPTQWKKLKVVRFEKCSVLCQNDNDVKGCIKDERFVQNRVLNDILHPNSLTSYYTV